jgi:peptidoglycan/xylan/chitin deacetylase (PgdA/CDA1 family)
MRLKQTLGFAISILWLGACGTPSTPIEIEACDSPNIIGQFDTSSNVFVAHFDSKPDVDDLHSIAAVGSLLTLPEMACVEAIAIAGAYGEQSGEYISSPTLFDMAFGENWLDGNGDRAAAVAAQAELFVETIENGGDVWIMVAGQGDIAADALVLAKENAPDLDYKTRLHLVQHSDWNESVTNVDKLALLRAETDYRKIPDGNAQGNGSPGFTSDNGALWERVLADPKVGLTWREAKRLADAKNDLAAYVNPSVKAGGFDFSDTVEATHIFGLDDLDDVESFFARVAPEPIVWPNGATAALALTYDDALPSQLENAVPALDARGLKATFYVSLGFDGFEQRKSVWTRLAENGHELGNHTLVHPCQESKPGRNWVQSAQDLDGYTLEKWLVELKAANTRLTAIDGETERTFAYTCGDTEIDGVSFIEDIKPLFLGARSVERGVAYDDYYVPSFAVDETSAEDMIAYVDELIATRAIGTITFHGIGGGHLLVTSEAHEALLDYLIERENDIWIAPMRDIIQQK